MNERSHPRWPSRCAGTLTLAPSVPVGIVLGYRAVSIERHVLTHESRERKSDSAEISDYRLQVPAHVIVVMRVGLRPIIEMGDEDVALGKAPVIADHDCNSRCHEESVSCQECSKD